MSTCLRILESRLNGGGHECCGQRPLGVGRSGTGMREGQAISPSGAVTGRPGYGRDFQLFATGQAVSVIGDRIATIALVFLVIQLSRSYAPALALFYVCRVLPTLLGGLLVGVLVDHFNRQRLMVVCDVSRALVVTALPLLGALTLWALYPLVGALYALTLVFDTAARAALPDVIRESRITGANAVLNAIQTAADLAYAAGGVLIFAFKLGAPFYIDAATFLFSSVMVAGMRFPVHARGPLPRVGEIVARTREGIQFMLGHPFLKWSTLTFTFAPFAGGVVFVLAPLYASKVLGTSPGLIGPLRSGAFRFSVLEVSLGAGAVVGSAVAAKIADRWPRGRLFGLGIVGLGAADGLLSFVSNIYLAAAVMFLGGLFNSLFVVSGMTLLQTLTPSDVRGRVVAARITVINSALALGSAVGGALLLVFSYATLWLVLGAIIIASSGFIWLRSEVRSQP